MNKEMLWKIYTEKNPDFLTRGANFTAMGLKHFFEQTWQTAHDHGVENGKVLGRESEQKKQKRENPLSAFFGIN